MTTYYWVITIALCALIIVTRMLPFFIGRYMSAHFNQAGKLLPAYIMLLLVIYEMDISTLTVPPYGVPAFLSLGGLLIVHLIFRMTLLSLVTGTVLFLLLSHVA